MTLNLSDARLDVYNPGNTSTHPDDADVQIEPPDFDSLQVSPRLQDLVDQADITIRNPDAVYTGDVGTGDRLEFYVKREGDNTLRRLWTGLARNVTHVELGANQYELQLTADDFVFGILDTRDFTGSFEDDPISGAETAVLDVVLQENAPEIDRSQIDAFSDPVTPIYNGTKLLEIVREMAERVDAVVAADGKSLVFTELANLTSQFTLTGADRGLATNTANDDALANALRVNGGEGAAVDTQIAGPPASYTTVTDSTRLSYQFQTRKSSQAKIELWTRPIAGSSDDIIARLHPNDPAANNPVDADDRESDIVSRRLSQEFLDDDGLTTFLLPDHTLADRDPWLLIESTGSTGQDIGVDVSGDPVYTAYFPFPVDVLLQSTTSVDAHRRRERTTTNTALTSRQDLINFARAVLTHTDQPDRELQFPAESRRAHLLQPGDIFTASAPEIGVSGDHIVTVASHNYEGMTLDTTITAQDVSTV